MEAAPPGIPLPQVSTLQEAAAWNFWRGTCSHMHTLEQMQAATESRNAQQDGTSVHAYRA